MKNSIKKINWKKCGGLMPAIIQESNTDTVLMLGYMNKESFIKTLKTKKVWFYSRSRKRLWMKGETSKNVLNVVSITPDCDSDSLLIKVKPSGPTCHRGNYSCFGKKKFSLQELYDTLFDRKSNPRDGSFSSMLLLDEKLIKLKIKEECKEVLDYKSRRNLIWEIADLTYFVMLLMVKRGIKMDEIMNELRMRRK